MGVLNNLLGSQLVQPVEAVGNVLDKLFTSDEERLDKTIMLTRLNQQPSVAQIELNKIEAQHRSIFVAGWRPFIGWVCGFNLMYLTFLRDLVAWGFGAFAPHMTPPPAIGADMTTELVIALLGLGALRTVEKNTGRTR